MSGGDYLDAIKAQLKSGKSAWRRADNVFRAFGYVRRRQSAVDQFNKELAARGMRAEPPLSTTIPLAAYVRFFLSSGPARADVLELMRTPSSTLRHPLWNRRSPNRSKSLRRPTNRIQPIGR